MEVVDAHLHLDPSIDGTAFGAAKHLALELEQSSIKHAIVLHLQTQPWSIEEVVDAISSFPSMRAFVNIHPHEPGAADDLKRSVAELGVIGLKLHPRLQNFDVSSSETVQLCHLAGELDIPVLIDAFPDGTYLMQGFDPLKYAELAKHCPQTNFIWAHMGGHHVLDFLMLAKRLLNVRMDISYSLLYYQTSPIVDSMVYAMRSMKFQRIFYGSDYPDRSIGISLSLTIDTLRTKGMNESEINKILSENALEFFKWTKK